MTKPASKLVFEFAGHHENLEKLKFGNMLHAYDMLPTINSTTKTATVIWAQIKEPVSFSHLRVREAVKASFFDMLTEPSERNIVNSLSFFRQNV